LKGLKKEKNKIEIVESYSTPYNGVLCVFICRVNPEKIKKVHHNSIYVVNEPSMDVISYRLLEILDK
jgi:hypothetical protein